MRTGVWLLICIAFFGCSTYISRPQIDGYIYDETGEGIRDVSIITWNGNEDVVETYSNEKGYFLLDQKKKFGFSDQKHLIQFLLQKENYRDTLISQFYPMRQIEKDTIIRFDTLVMKSKD